MDFLSHTPAAPIDEYVSNILYLKQNNQGTSFPKIGMSIVFNLKDDFKLYDDSSFLTFTNYKKYWVAGMQLGPRHVESYGQSEMVILQFKPFGPSRFFKEPLHYFTDNYISLEDVHAKLAEETWERMCEAKEVKTKLHIAEDFLMRIYKLNTSSEGKASQLVRDIQNVDTRSKIATLCDQYGVSRKHLNAVFKKHIGLSPKHILSMMRLQRTLHAIHQNEDLRLTDLAYELDYFDQAHFNNDFKKLTGRKPSEYLADVSSGLIDAALPHYIPYISR